MFLCVTITSLHDNELELPMRLAMNERSVCHEFVFVVVLQTCRSLSRTLAVNARTALRAARSPSPGRHFHARVQGHAPQAIGLPLEPGKSVFFEAGW
jgi:hypothetical protein